MKKVHAEIEYIGENREWAHSDVCPPGCDFDRIDDRYRKLLHRFLDEWLDESNGTGAFYIASDDWEGSSLVLSERDSERFSDALENDTPNKALKEAARRFTRIYDK